MKTCYALDCEDPRASHSDHEAPENAIYRVEVWVPRGVRAQVVVETHPPFVVNYAVNRDDAFEVTHVPTGFGLGEQGPWTLRFAQLLVEELLRHRSTWAQLNESCLRFDRMSTARGTPIWNSLDQMKKFQRLYRAAEVAARARLGDGVANTPPSGEGA